LRMLLEPFGGPGRRLPAQPGSSNKWVARGTISSRQIDDLEPALTRHGYDVRTLADRFNVKPIEIKALLAGNPARRAYPRADRSHERRWGPRMKSCRINKERCRVRVSAVNVVVQPLAAPHGWGSMLVFAQVSSINTRRLGSSCFWPTRNHCRTRNKQIILSIS
jgi:hypothetical protein